MNDMTRVIAPKSDQINADDLIAGPMTITIADVSISPDSEQPVSIKIEGERKVWRPCKSMSRALVAVWGPDAKAYVGRSVTLYRDPKVKWGGLEVGGIRISHMSHLDGKKTLMLTETRAKRSPCVISPLQVGAPAQTEDRAARWAEAYEQELGRIQSADELESFAQSKAAKLGELHEARPELAKRVKAALEARRSELSETTRRTDEQHGDQFSDDADAPLGF